jgi:hypothetical protein
MLMALTLNRLIGNIVYMKIADVDITKQPTWPLTDNKISPLFSRLSLAAMPLGMILDT